jgi:ISXO2-like transposase domain
MLHRIRLAMQDEQRGGKLGGEVEVDETFIGGKARNMHKDRKKRANVQMDNKGKTLVLGILQREGAVRAKVVPDRGKATIQSAVRENVEKRLGAFF